ncbi:hypothetical protein HanXRQr2_Chr14g0638631 [Helianthus annuus]|uniref:Uncharacterized protein n=1 Tax=Helianthus annuus TaxID=4232 RepID=A0A251TSN9_HELAN|nr:hypothetical protein HanXRQr2_Chr14g0638631 [Helianthus annuus]KAJ0655890.1 hypothetical protein HanLR1_Chr14g0529431 [Helianthus annuus]
MQKLDVINVRELEDFLINECMYMGIVKGKLDQLRRCFQVQFAAGGDLRPGQLGSMIHTLTLVIFFSDCYLCISLSTSDNLLITIQDKIKWADTMSEMDKKHKKEAGERMEEMKKTISLKVSCIYFSHHHFLICEMEAASLSLEIEVRFAYISPILIRNANGRFHPI